MAITRVHTWASGEILLASDLNAEFNNITGNGADLVSPFTKAISMGGFAFNFDAANTIAATATTSGVILTGGTFREPAEDTVTAFATGGQTNATALSAARKFHRISVCATTADSYKLPTSTAGQCHYVRNDGAAAAQAFGAGTDTINGVATATGIPHPVGVGIWFVCTTAGNWTTGPLVAVSGNFPVTFTATAATGITLPTTGTLATLAGAEELTSKTLTSAVGKGTWTASGTWTLPAVTFSGAVTLAGTNILSGTFDRIAIATAAGKIIPGATSLSLRNNADSADNLLVSDAGSLTRRTGTGSGTALIGGKLTVDTTSNSNVTTGETNLTSYVLAANTLSSNGKGVKIKAWGVMANNGNTKTVRLYFGATAILNSVGVTTAAALSWILDAYIFRTSSNNQICTAWFSFGADGVITSSGDTTINSTTAAITDSGTITIKCTGQSSAASNDITQNGLLVEFLDG